MLLCAFAPRAAFAAEGGSMDLGVMVGEQVTEAESGDVGSVELGVAVGLGVVPDESTGTDRGGSVALGVAVGYWTPAGESTVVFDAGKGSFDEGAAVAERTVATGVRIEPPAPEPKRPGWKFAGWHVAGAPSGSWDDDGASALPLGEAWDFTRPVTEDLELHVRWELRLDVTVPVAVGFAVDAGTGEATGPEAGRCALKSRTVRDVEVESLALECRQGELEAFFEAPASGWQAVLAATSLSLGGERAPAIELPFADGGSMGPTWQVTRPLTEAERMQWRVPAFSYGGLAPDDGWQGIDPCQRLALDVGLTVSDEFEVKVGQAGAVPIAHLKLTVSTKL